MCGLLRSHSNGDILLVKISCFSRKLTCYFIGLYNKPFLVYPPTQAFLGDLVFHLSPQTPAQPKTTFLSHA